MARNRRTQNDFLGDLRGIGRQFGILVNRGMATAYEAGAYRFLGNQFMVITTTGRKSGQPRTTPIGYVETGNYIYTLSRGEAPISNWVRNVKVNPKVKLQIGERVLGATGEVLEDPTQVRQVIRLYLKHRPSYSRFLKVDQNSTDEELDRVSKKWLAVRFAVKGTK